MPSPPGRLGEEDLPSTLSTLIDLHCHILPGTDDGPTTLDESLALARVAVAAGTEVMVATPHVSWDFPGNSAAGIAEGVARLRVALSGAGIPLELLTGGEIAMDRAVGLPDEELAALRLGGPKGTHLLVECPFAPSAVGFAEVLGSLRSRGHEILLAHPERCPAFQRNPAAYEEFVAQGMLGQVTAGALVGSFGRAVQTLGEHLVRNGLAHVVASDGHSADRRRPSIRRELLQAGLQDRADWLGRAVPAAILSGRPLPPPPEEPDQRRSTRARLFGR